MKRYEVRARVRTIGPAGFVFEPVPVIFLPYKTVFFAKRAAMQLENISGGKYGLEYYVHDRKKNRDLY
jgi:hypothetical protein